MAIKVADVGEIPLLQAMIDNVLLGATVHLFVNNHTPDDEDTESNYTECSCGGYTEQSCTSWSTPTTGDDGKAFSRSNNLVFSPSGCSEIIYGWYMIAAGVLIEAEKFDEPQDLSIDPSPVSFRIRQTCNSEF